MSPGRIDLHSHFLPDVYRAAAIVAGHEHPDGAPMLPQWDADEHVAALDRIGIRLAALSISSPGVHFGDDAAARSLARAVNTIGRETKARHPGRFGHFASLPLPDVDGAVAEIDYCTTALGVDGFTLLTNAHGTYLGDAALDPVFDALDHHHARVFLHPTSPPCWDQVSMGRPRAMIEFLFDTSRAVVDMVLNGVVARYPNIRFIVPHAGAALPVLADRVAAVAGLVATVAPGVDVLRDLASLHYDLAGFPLPRQFDTLLTIATAEHLHYGSDYPFTPEFLATRLAAELDAIRPDHRPLIERLAANTERLFPQFAAAP